MELALIICIPTTALIVGFLVLKSISLGLKWQIQTSNEQEPELNNPISQMVETHKQNKISNEVAAIASEWVNGEIKE